MDGWIPIGLSYENRWVAIDSAEGKVWLLEFSLNNFSRIASLRNKVEIAASFCFFLDNLVGAPEVECQCTVKNLARQSPADIHDYVARGGDLHAISEDGDTLLQEAIKLGNWQAFEACLSLGVNTSGSVHTAVYIKGERYLEALINAGADVNERTPKFPSPPLAIACGFERKAIRQILTENGASAE